MPVNANAQYVPNSGTTSAAALKDCQSKICFTWMALITLVDVAFAVNNLSQFASNPSNDHHAAVSRVFRYLLSTIGRKIKYSGNAHFGTHRLSGCK
jgi:hypothetical protein